VNAKVGLQFSFVVFTLAFLAQRFWNATDPMADETLRTIVGAGKIISLAGIVIFGSSLIYGRFRSRADSEASSG
jgi:hypothetical protein